MMASSDAVLPRKNDSKYTTRIDKSPIETSVNSGDSPRITRTFKFPVMSLNDREDYLPF